MTCDRSGVCPIVGMRYHLRGDADYDLCQAEYDKLTSEEQSQYEAIPPPDATADASAMEVDEPDAAAAGAEAAKPAAAAGAALVPRLYLSSLPATGYRGVRPSAALRTASSASGFEVAVWVDGKEKTLGPYETVLEAAHEYRRMVGTLLDDDGKLAELSRAVSSATRGAGRGGGGTAGTSASGGAGASGGAARGKKQPPPGFVWDEKMVGRRIRAFFPGSGVWLDGTLTAFVPPTRAARKEGAKFTASYDDGDTEDLTLPDESVRLLPEGFHHLPSPSTDLPPPSITFHWPSSTLHRLPLAFHHLPSPSIDLP